MASRAVLIDGDSYEISYEKFLSNSSGNGCETILILHGWGANKELMSGVFASKFSDFNQIYIDLPGFGKSSQPARPLNSYDYAKIVREFLADLGAKPRFILGHSFGGKVATLLVPDILILCSSAGILEPKSLKIRAKIGVFKGLKYVGLGKFWRIFASDDANKMSEIMYATFKNVVAEDFGGEFDGYETKFEADKRWQVLIFWGKEDRAVSLKSGEKIASLIKNSQFFPLSGDHFFFIKNADFIAQKITQISRNLG